jgi:hypothetical protein
METPEVVRWHCLEVAKELGFEPARLRRFVAQRTGVVPENNHGSDSALWAQVTSAVKSCQWFHVYDIIEDIYKWLEKDDEENLRVGGLGDEPLAHRYTEALNELFLNHNIGWQLVNGQIVTRGNEGFHEAVETATSQLNENRRPTAASHIQSAVKALSARPKPNTPGAVSHATNAVECLLHDITGQAMTLGKYLDKYPGLFHPSLKKSARWRVRLCVGCRSAARERRNRADV